MQSTLACNEHPKIEEGRLLERLYIKINILYLNRRKQVKQMGTNGSGRRESPCHRERAM